MDTALVSRIKKLLALADPTRNPNAEEAQAALLKARQMMAEHGLTEAAIAMGSDRPQEETVKEASVGGGLEVEVWEEWFAVNIAKAFRCRAYLRPSRYGKEIRVFGRETDVAVAVEAIMTMRTVAYHLSDRWERSLGRRAKKAERLGYLHGFVEGVRRAIEDQSREHPEWALVLATPAVVTRYATDVLHLRPAPRRHVTMADIGRRQGWQDGYDAWSRRSLE